MIQVIKKVRYIRDWINGSTANTSTHWVELQAYDEIGANVALNKPTYSESGVTVGEVVTNGITDSNKFFDGKGNETFIVVDLEGLYTISEIRVWHYYRDDRRYYESKTEVSSDGVNWLTVFDSATEGEYTETPEGNTIKVKEFGEVFELKVWDGDMLRNAIGSVMTPSGLEVFYRPVGSFEDNGNTQKGMIKDKFKSNSLVVNGKIMFGELRSFDVYEGELKDDTTKSPGSKLLKGGSMSAGYFGIVTGTELFDGEEISSEVGITEGNLINKDAGWMKFSIDGKIIFKSQKPYRNTITHEHIDGAGCVDGSKKVMKNGVTYKVRLMRTGLTNPLEGYGSYLHHSEWNRLMLPIHENAKDQSWRKPNNVDIPTEYWGIDFTDNDLWTNSSAGVGAYQWVMETYGGSPMRRGYGGVSDGSVWSNSRALSHNSWSPVLEVIE